MTSWLGTGNRKTFIYSVLGIYIRIIFQVFTVYAVQYLYPGIYIQYLYPGIYIRVIVRVAPSTAPLFAVKRILTLKIRDCPPVPPLTDHSLYQLHSHTPNLVHSLTTNTFLPGALTNHLHTPN